MLYQRWKKKRFELITSEWQLDELSGVLSRPKLQRYLTGVTVAELLSEMALFAEVVPHLPTLLLSPDPDDDHILAIAIGGEVDYLVTGDKRDLLSLVDVQGIPIITPRLALQKLD